MSTVAKNSSENDGEKPSNEADDTIPSKGKRSWVGPALSTIFGIAASIAIAWYQLSTSNEQALQAERERQKAVQNELVTIVEDHVINQKPLDIFSLGRLAEFRARQERLAVAPSATEIVQNAEYNILRSPYLEFSKKQQYRVSFSEIYQSLFATAAPAYTGLFENSVNDMFASVQKGNAPEITAKIHAVLNDFNGRISELESTKIPAEKTLIANILRIMLDKPTIPLLGMLAYIIAFYVLTSMWRRKRAQHKWMADYREIQAREELLRYRQARAKSEEARQFVTDKL